MSNSDEVQGIRSISTRAQSLTKGHDFLKDPFIQKPMESAGLEGVWFSEEKDSYELRENDARDGTYLSLFQEGRLYQDFSLPEWVAQGYALGCQYNVLYFTDSCWLRVYALSGGSQGQIIHEQALKNPETAEQADEQDPRPEAEPTWHTLTPKIIDIPPGVSTIRVAFETPVGTRATELSLRNIISEVHLAPFEGSVLLSPGPDQPSLAPQAQPPFKLCHGATYSLHVSDAWQGQKLSVLWPGNPDTSPTTYGLTTNPSLNIDDSDEESRYPQPEAGTSTWSLSASAAKEVMSGALPLGLGSYWRAEKHELQAQLGDFRYEVSEVAWDGVVPVLEWGISTRLTATLGNLVASARTIVGHNVDWYLDDVLYKTVPTDEQGKSTLEFIPEQKEGVDFYTAELSARCTDGLGAESDKLQAIPVYSRSPWSAQFDVLFDDRPITDFDEVNLVLDSVGEHTLTLKPKSADNFFIGEQVALGWPGGTPQLDITFSPSEPQEMTAAGVSWTIMPGVERDHFTLEVITPTLSLPLSLKGLRLSPNLEDEIELTLADAVPANPALFWREETQTLKVTLKPGSPLAKMKTEAWLTFTDGSLKPTSVVAAPSYGERRAMLEDGLSWTLTSAQVSGTFGVQVHMQGFDKPMVVDTCVLMSRALADEAELIYDDERGTDESTWIFRRMVPSYVGVKPKNGSPLAESGLKVKLTFVEDDLAPEQMEAYPDYEAEQGFTEGEPQWEMLGKQASGVFGLAIHVAGFSKPLVTGSCLLLSLRMEDEFDVLIDAVPLVEPLVIQSKAEHTLSIVPKMGSPLEREFLSEAWIEYVDGSLPQAQLITLPTYNDRRPISTAGLSWKLTAEAPGTFGLSIQTGAFPAPLTLTSGGALSQDLTDEVDVKVEGRVVDDLLVFRRSVGQTVVLVPKPGSTLANLEQEAWMTLSAGSVKEGDVSASPDFGAPRVMSSEGLEWEVTGGDLSGQFSLVFHVAGFSTVRTLPTCVLLSSKLADEAAVIYTPHFPSDPQVFYREEYLALTLVAKSGSPLLATRPSAWMEFKSPTLKEDDMWSLPAFGSKVILSQAGVCWNTRGREASGHFNLTVHVDGFDKSITVVPNVMLSRSGANELLLRLTSTGPDIQLVAVPVEGSPLANHAYLVSLSSSPDPGFVPTPPFNVTRVLRSSGLSWNLGPPPGTVPILTIGGPDFPCPLSFPYIRPR
ncbi:hypothetical protein [Pseudomonas sp. MNR3A]|uniref:hypothetical protein n=1 Tax=Pseudomonas sp. MNR3A TaxID=2615213 RepID=UPI00129BFD6A|nr:hypothetical protein [Pseudomonas sp. MNR3A]